MQFKRDTDYALRILFGLAEGLAGGEDGQQGVPTGSIAAKTGIPKPSFERICGYLEQHGIIYQEMSSRGEPRMYPGEGFWDQSLLQIADAVEGGTQLFAVFDRRSQLFRQCGGKLEAIQSGFDKILSGIDLKSMFFSK